MTYGSAGVGANLEFSNNFAIEVDGVQLMAFETCDMGEFSYAVAMNRTGVDAQRKTASAGLLNDLDFKFGKHVRRAGIADIKQFFDWWKNRDTDKRDGAVIFLDQTGGEICRFPFYGAICHVFAPPKFTSDNADEAALFEVTIRPEDADMEV